MSGNGLIATTRSGAVIVLGLQRPPVNALNAPLMAALGQAVEAAQSDATVSAIVLAAEGTHFSAGLDVSELGRVQGAALPRLVQIVENCSKPVVAAMQGNALGGALELALACHGRVAQENARLGLPEISLGLLPTAGTTQRLPRLVGAPIALKLLLDGVPLSAVEALAMGLLDAVVETNPVAQAVALAQSLAEAPVFKASDRREGMRDPFAYQSAITEARKKVEGWRLPAPAAVIDCVEAAMLLPFDMGLGFEQSHAETMAESPEAAGLRHAFLAERRALFPPAELSAAAPPKLARIVILGTSGMVPDVARQALSAGLQVRLIADSRAKLTEALKTIAARQEAMVAAKQMKPAARDADWARLTGVLAEEGADVADLVLLAADAPKLASLPGPAIGLGGRGPLILHPTPISGGLAELSIGPGVPLENQVAALAFGRKLGWKVMVQGPGAPIDQRMRLVLSRAIAVLETQGHDRQNIAAALAAMGLGAGNRQRLPAAPPNAEVVQEFCMAAMMNEGARIISEGGARRPSDVDAAVLISGLFPRWAGGPMFGADQLGLMVLRARLRKKAETTPQIFAPAPVLDELISQGKTFADLNRE